MNYDQARARIGDVRRWTIPEWEWHDVTAETYWNSNPEPDAPYSHAVTEIDDAVAREYPRANQAKQLLDSLDANVDTIVRQAFERSGEQPEKEVIQNYGRHARKAIRRAVAADLADGWLLQQEIEELTAGYRAADEKLQFDFSLMTESATQGVVADTFTEAVRARYESVTVTSDPHHRAHRKFDVGGFAYKAGTPAAADQALQAELQALLTRHDDQGLIGWPPADFHAQRPNRG